MKTRIKLLTVAWAIGVIVLFTITLYWPHSWPIASAIFAMAGALAAGAFVAWVCRKEDL